MKGKILKIVVTIVVAGATGGGIYCYFRWKKAKNEDEKPLEQVYIPYEPGKKDVKEKISQLFDRDKDDILRDQDDPKHEKTDIDPEKFADAVHNYLKSDEERENMEAYMAGMESPEEDEDEEDMDDEDDPGVYRGNGPYRISAGDFCNTRTYYDKVSLNYFQKDGVIGDERDKVFENAEHILGDVQGAFDSEDYPDNIYIRNEELEIDYEISLVRGSYRWEVLHLEEEEE